MTSKKDQVRKRVTPLTEEAFVGGAKSEAAEIEPTEKPAGKAGRPRRKAEGSKNKAFNLPLSLIDRIDQEAETYTIGNATAFAAALFEAYFGAKDEGRAGVVFGIEIKPKK